MMLRAGWLPSTLILAVACRQAPPPIDRASVSVPKSPPQRESSPASDRLFAGHEGTCRVEANGHVHCWGRVPNGLEELAVREHARQLAFFGEYSGPYCVLNERALATCHLRSPIKLNGPPSTVEGVRSMQKLKQDLIGLLRNDGSTCVVTDREVDCTRLPPADTPYSTDVTLQKDGTVWAPQGSSDSGASGVRARLPGFEDIHELAVSSLHICGCKANGDVSCSERAADDGPFGGRPGSTAPHSVPPLSCAAQLVSGDAHTCAQACDNRTYCWGSNEVGQIAPLPPAPASHTLELRGVSQVAAGVAHTCAVLEDGGVWCWGDPYGHRLGMAALGKIFAKPTPVALPDRARAVSCSGSTSCALLIDGRVSCWGDARVHSFHTQSPPHMIEGVAGASQIAAGDRASCALVDGTVVCWGSNEAGLRGVDGEVPPTPATLVAGVQGAVNIDVGDDLACAVLVDGHVKCWGTIDSGFPTPTPKSLADVKDAAEVSVSTLGYCVRFRNGSGSCAYRAGDPLQLRWPSGVKSIAAEAQACALMLDGGVKCSAVPTAVESQLQGLKRVRSLTMGAQHACTLDDDSKLTCVGQDRYGQLGMGQLLLSTEAILVP